MNKNYKKGEYFSTNNYIAPAVYIEILGVKFGLASYNEVAYDITSYERPITPSSLSKYPNIITKLKVNRLVDGSDNQYTLTIKYLPQDGDDPSYIDKLLAANYQQNDSKMIIAYGDSSLDGFIRNKMEATILKSSMSVDLETSALEYTIKALSLSSIYSIYKDSNGEPIQFSFPARKDMYPSEILKLVYNDPIYQLKKVFPGGITINGIDINEINDSNRPDIFRSGEVISESKCNPYEYLIRVVKSMYSSEIGTKDNSNKPFIYSINDSYMNQSFDIFNLVTNSSEDYVDEVEIGIEDSKVTSYKFDSDFSYLMYQSYASENNEKGLYKYYYDDKGNEYKVKSYDGSASVNSHEQIARDKRWYESVSELPYALTLTTRYLKRSIPLGSNLKVTIIIKGQVHWTSGIFMITESVDEISTSGYSSTLKMLRLKGATYQ